MRIKTKNKIYIMLYRFFGVVSIACLVFGALIGGMTGSIFGPLAAGVAFAMFPFFACYACANRSVELEKQIAEADAPYRLR